MTVIDDLKIKEWIYNLLGRYFYRQPTYKDLTKLKQDNYFEQVIKLGRDQGLDVEHLTEFVTQISELSNLKLEQLQAEYRRLFVGPGELVAPPWQSVYRNDGNIIFSADTLAVRRFYRCWGFQLASQIKEPDDHLGLELEFMALTTADVLQAIEGKERDRLLKLLKTQHKFLTDHLLQWVDEFVTRVTANSEENFYTGLALFTLQYLKLDAKLVEGLISDLDELVGLEVGQRLDLTGCKGRGLERGEFVEEFQEVERIIPTGGTNNCGGRCLIKAHVKDDIIVRLSTDDQKPDQPATPQARACVRGRAYRKTNFSPHRLKYPLKRVGPRGEGKFERISWKEAIETIASEIRRIGDQYGPTSRYVHYAWGYNARIQAMSLAERLLALDGGYLGKYNSYSTACTKYATPYTYGTTETGNSLDDWVNSELIILWGHNPAETVFGPTMYHLHQAKEAGAKIIVVDPRYSDTAVALADEWISILPTTDNAVMDAMAYVMITEDLYDQEFVEKYCIGFDQSQMPNGVADAQSYKSYILGESDNIAKTPQWAEEISKVPADTIKRLAREYATAKSAALVQGWGPQRHAYGEQVVRGGTVLAAMTGNVGNNGGWASGAGYVSRQTVPKVPIPPNPVKAKIPVFLWTDAIVRGTKMGAEDGVKGVDKLSSNIKLIMNLAGNALINQHSDCNRTAQILKDESKVEFIVVSELFMTSSAKYADILLPGDTFFERNNISTPWGYGDYVIYNNKVVDAPFECRSEYDWLVDVADKLGIKEEFSAGKKSMEDWCKWIVEGIQKHHPEFPTYQEFKKSGIYKWSYDEPKVAFKEQIEDPANNPFPTPSGKIEIFSKRLFKMNQPQEIPAIPKYIPAWEGPSDQLTEKYPLQCIAWHYKRRCHSTHDNNDWLEEVARQEIWINPQDAAVRGIEDGAEVRVFNDRGTIQIPAKITPRIIPGVVAIPQGAWWEPDQDGVDRGGNINTLTTHRPTPLAKGNPQHTNLVEVSTI
ncbi:molybdopterin-dependent oxidoreductase [Natroniella sulfidigena]|uniref:DMSO/selenate family reductase complex A subunit n=1 Tax=Natroniella sulfidigena TaxID=723921 RepID=UPI00200A4254|nr:DMSO/selenate family reductase complex A subunit [Natroniella sulfidigena]MCK8817849.1 molybdopterin-dependent oxidoreductase [Natroniella sulfidigena]